MSVRIMTAVWDIDLPDSAKIVLLALADCANDEGLAWPSIATIARKCSKSERTVQTMVRSLCDDGHMTREEIAGVGCRYHLHPRKDCTPAEDAPPQTSHRCNQRRLPPQPLRGTPAAVAPKPSKNHQRTIPPTPQSGGKSARCQIDQDWKAPSIAELPPEIAALAALWPAGAYEAEAMAFHQHWLGTGGRNADWAARWAARVQDRHQAVMRAAKAGVSYAGAARARPAAAAAAKRQAPEKPVAAKADEDDASANIHAAVRAGLGDAAWERWFSVCAILSIDGGLQVVAPTPFSRDWISDHYGEAITRAASAAGVECSWVKIEAAQLRRAR